MNHTPTQPKRRRRYIVILVLLALAVILSIFAYGPYREQRVANSLSDAGAWVSFHHQYEGDGTFDANAEPPGPEFMRSLVGNHFFADVHSVDIPSSADLIDLSCLRALPNLQELSIDGPNVSDEAMEHIATLDSLVSLELTHGNLSNHGFKQLAALSNLRSLTISHCRVDESLFDALSCSSSLRELVLVNAEIDDAALQHIPKFSKLRLLELRANKIGDVIFPLASRLSQLEVLGLAGTHISGRGINVLNKCPSLRALILRSTAMDDEAMLQITEVQSLKELDICNTRVTDEGFLALRNLPSLEHLGIVKTSVSDNAVTRLLEASPNVAVFGPSIDHPSQAGQFYESLIVDDPTNVDARFLLAVTNAKSGRHDEAILGFTEVIRQSPGRYHAWIGRAIEYRDTDALVKAKEDLQRAIQIQPDNPVAYEVLGIVYGIEGNLERAVEQFTESISRAPVSDQFTALKNRGTAYLKLGKFRQAIDDLSRAIELVPEDSELYRRRAEAYRHAGDEENASNDDRRAHEQSNKNEDSQLTQ